MSLAIYLDNSATTPLCESAKKKIAYMLDECWEIKKKFAGGVSNELINDMYEKAKSSGALGGKILGAGGGGFLLLYVPLEKQSNVREALKDFRLVDFNFESQGSRIIFAD